MRARLDADWFVPSVRLARVGSARFETYADTLGCVRPLPTREQAPAT